MGPAECCAHPMLAPPCWRVRRVRLHCELQCTHATRVVQQRLMFACAYMQALWLQRTFNMPARLAQ
jgi:hypothetical protein